MKNYIEISEIILFHANAYKDGIIDSDDFTNAIIEILDEELNK